MKIIKQEFLDNLQMVRAGLSPREFIEQSSCFVFQDKEVMTFNDEIACRKSIGVNLTGAVQADSLLSILEKLNDPELLVLENEKGELEFRGKRKRFWLTRSAEVFLPIDRVEQPEKWKKLPQEFAEAISRLRHCVSTDETKFILTCVHITPTFMQACDNKQLLRWQVETPIKKDLLVRGVALNQIIDLAMQEMAVTESWVHFRNSKGLIFSCRKYLEDYPSVDSILEFKGRKITLPKTLIEASERATIFAAENSGDALLTISLVPGKLRLTGTGLTGGYEELKRITYDGPPLKFVISPEVLRHIVDKYEDAQISPDKLRATQKGSWDYVTVLGRPETAESRNGAAEAEESDEGAEE